MDRVVVLGRGGAGKSTLAVALGAALDLPVVEHGGGAVVHRLRGTADVERFLAAAR